MSTPATVRESYRRRAAELRAEQLEIEAASRRLGAVRFMTFLVALVPWVGAELSSTVPDGVAWGSVPLAIVFFVLVARHRRLRAHLRRVEVAADLADHGLARIDRRWVDLPDPAPEPARAGRTHPWARDLDLYGRASLRSLLGPVFTPPGRARLDAWLLDPVEPTAARGRQEAVRELVGKSEVRTRTAVEGALLDPVDEVAMRAFLSWCEAPTQVPRWLGRVAWFLPLITLSLVVADLGFGLLPAGPWIVGLAIQTGLAWRWNARLEGLLDQASGGGPGLRRYHRLFAVWEECSAEAGLLASAVGALQGPDERASHALARLARWLDMADARMSSLHPVLAAAVLWDVHVGRGLDAWRRSAGRRADAWMEALADLEALSSVATLAADHPEWAFPQLPGARSEPPPAPEAAVFEARELGHPLLAETVCVRNDVRVGPPGSVLLITGSNMSGKSTLLRSIGLAVVLAGAGGPVCAARLRLPACRLFTSMRVQDSIEAGVSFFMAELERLVALLREAPADGDARPVLFYLVDEILQGTNSDERRIAGRRLVRHLLRRRAIGAVTTHDLEFHLHPDIAAAAELVHFRESVEGEAGGARLSFDYRLRSGLATTRNALLLAERVGLTALSD